MATYCCICGSKIRGIPQNLSIEHYQDKLCEICHAKRQIVLGKRQGDETSARAYLMEFCQKETGKPIVTQTIREWLAEEAASPQETVLDKLKSNLETTECLYVITGQSTKVPFGDKYKTTISAYADHIEIEKDGRTSTSHHVNIPYDNLCNIRCYKQSGCLGIWLTFDVLGNPGSGAQSIGIANIGKLSVGTAESNPWLDSYSVNFDLMLQQLEAHCSILMTIYNFYKEMQKKSVSSTVFHHEDSPLDSLKKLKELLDLGIISEDEYSEKRTKLLEQI